MTAEDRGNRHMNSVKKSLSDDTSLAEFVEKQLDEALRGLPMIWRLGDTGLEIERAPGNIIDRIDLYYDLQASRDLEAFVLTHSNVTAGLWSQRWLIRKATLIPFTALTIEHSIYSDQALSLAQLVADICLSCEPNLDWPT
jgi:hypothetical protein